MKYIQIIAAGLLFLANSVSYANADAGYLIDQDTTTATNNFEINMMSTLLVAETAMGHQDYATALKHYKALALETHDPKIAQRATEVALIMRDLDSARTLSQIWADAMPKDLEAQATTALLLLSDSRVESSLVYLSRMHDLDPDTATANFQLLQQELMAAGRVQAMEEALALLIEAHPMMLSAHLTLANLYLESGQADKTLTISNAAITSGIQDAGLVILKTESMRQLGQKEDARSFIESSLSDYPEAANLKLYYADLLTSVFNETKASQAVLAEIAALPNVSSMILIDAIQITMDEQWFDSAAPLLATLKKDPEQKETAYYFLARVAEEKQSLDEAIQLYQRVEQGPFQSLSHARAANLLVILGNEDEALSLLRRAEPATTHDLKLVTLLQVDILTKREAYSDAMKVLNDALSLFAADLDMLYVRSLVAEQMGDMEVAYNDLRIILLLYPNHIDALNTLGYMLMEHDQAYDEALALIERAYQLAPQDPGVLDSLGWLHYRSGNLSEAKQYLAKASQLLPSDPVIAAHYGEVLWTAGQQAKANEIWMGALAHHPKDPDLKETLNRFMPERANAKQDINLK